ncbi:DUF3304 domain-containing protein [Aromatoleum toluclasticum]|uniref:DUF3304 domain-containing protein n=1 Tax=Aromatoleum toluclasticum TaxID=92003 RepID=UPI001D18BBB8|nr:DUF3304 domain-containing protein [Aromatoleum toluclasticum]MCC4113794.1 DUF3304 domain-containing protein [Aromatoleum toluclasticum]
MKILESALAALAALALASCATPVASGNEPGQMLVPVNHTNRYAPNIVVEDAWAGNVDAQGGGGKATCCIAGRKDWSKPALVQWRWGAEDDRATGKIILAGEDRSALVPFPRAPHRIAKTVKDDWSTEDFLADELYLCVIFRTLDKVEFAFSSSASACRLK